MMRLVHSRTRCGIWQSYLYESSNTAVRPFIFTANYP